MTLENLKSGQTAVKILSLTDKAIKSVSTEKTFDKIYMRGKVRQLKKRVSK